MNNKTVEIDGQSLTDFKELTHFKCRFFFCILMCSDLMNKTLMCTGVDARAVIFIVIILGVNRP